MRDTSIFAKWHLESFLMRVSMWGFHQGFVGSAQTFGYYKMKKSYSKWGSCKFNNLKLGCILQSCLPFRFWRKKYDFRVNLRHSSDYTISPPNLPFFSGPLQKFLPNTILGIWIEFDQKFSWILLKLTRNLSLRSKVFPKLEQSIFKWWRHSYMGEDSDDVSSSCCCTCSNAEVSTRVW